MENNKPIQLVIEETKSKLNSNVLKIINESGLPMCCISPILKDIYERCVNMERQQYEAVKANYEQQKQQNNEVIGVE